MSERPTIPRVVRPRKEIYGYLPIVVADGDTVFVERTGELHPRSDLPHIVMTEKSSLFVAHNVGIYLRQLDELFDKVESWNFRVVPLEREVWRPNRERYTHVMDTVVSWFGFKASSKDKKYVAANSRYFYALDPLIFSRKNVNELDDSDRPVWQKLFEWASDVREWLLTQLIPMKPTHGAVAALLLKDRRFYPEPRRKVPRATNDKARPYLPGNYYRLRVAPWAEFPAVYIDQDSCHHSCARDITFPHADYLYGVGHFRDPLKVGARWYAKAGTPLYKKTIRLHGLFYLAVINPVFGKDRYPLPCQETPGTTRIFVYSNELDYLRETGTIIEGIIAAWVSAKVDTGLPAYAEWSLKEIAANPQYKAWLKPLLLATYGVLAGRPRKTEVGHKRANGGIDKLYPIGGTVIPVKAKVTATENEATISNVIHRGMIEAEARLRSLRMAAYMQSAGLFVIAIYADSVFVKASDEQLPFIPDGWRVEKALTRLRFFNEVSFDSDQISKLPGIPREDRQRLADARAIGAAAAARRKQPTTDDTEDTEGRTPCP